MNGLRKAFVIFFVLVAVTTFILLLEFQGKTATLTALETRMLEYKRFILPKEEKKEPPTLEERQNMWAQGETASWFRRLAAGDVTTFGKSPEFLCLYHRFDQAAPLCVEADLQVRHRFRIWLAPCHKEHGWRFQQLKYSAMEQHPYIEQVSTRDDAELFFWFPTCAQSFDPHSQLKPQQWRRLAVLEESDHPGNWNQVHKLDRVLAYMKRSWVDKRNGSHHHHSIKKRSRDNQDTNILTFLPLPYSVWDNYTLGLTLGLPRLYDIVCTVRTHAVVQPARTRIVQWLSEAANTIFNHTTVYLGDTGGHRKIVQDTYFNLMRNARIVVTCNPSEWDGDFRTYEALSTGALVFVDELHTPAPYPLVDGVHLIVYDTHDKDDFLAKLEFYLHRPHLAAAIAANGLYHVLKYHRAISRLDYVLRSLHLRLHEENLSAPKTPTYKETALDIRDSAHHETHRLLPWNPPDSLEGAILP
mmetsp:Transcript_2284/g.2978  ORF Transcript_2284/g.2978 Transcript_2284/m.2978 type:complete len:471 (-) Transcript_2284:6-1418(-)